MGIKNRKISKVAKGAPSGFVISLIVHAAAFMLAGLLVVFTVTKKEDHKFVPPQVNERPKMELKKPRVKVAKKAPTNRQTQRIVTKMNKASMPEIQLPEMSGITGNLMADIHSFNLEPDVEQITLFGGGQTIGNDFVGTFYDLKRSRSGRSMIMDPDKYVNAVSRFVRDGWKPSSLGAYYQSPKKLYASSFMIPPVKSSVAPSAFGEADTGGYTWLVHYKGQLVYPEDTRIRFWGNGDDILVVRVNGEVVLNASWPDGDWGTYNVGGAWSSSAKNNGRFYMGNNVSRVGDWIELKAGEPLEMEVLLGEVPGGEFCAMLTVEMDGMDYPKNRQGGPVLPMFKTDVPSQDLVDIIYRDMPEGEADIVSGPVFRDYGSAMTDAPVLAQNDNIKLAPELVEALGPRVWTVNNKQIEGDFVSTSGDRVILKSVTGKQHRVPAKDLSPNDREYLELKQAPEFNIAFTKNSTARRVETSPHLEEDAPRVQDVTFGARVSQKGSRPYNHELTVEYFAVAKEFSGNRYVLVERQSDLFIPSAENKRSHAFTGDPVEFIDYSFGGVHRGLNPTDYLITLTDKQGRVIQHRTSASWLYEHLDNLKQMPVGRYMDTSCQRVHPTRPKTSFY